MKTSTKHSAKETNNLFRNFKVFAALLAMCIFSFESTAAIFTVTNTNDSGSGSFRQAVADAESSSGADEIHFSIGSGAQVITMNSQINITTEINIVGSSQPGYSGSALITFDRVNNNYYYGYGLYLYNGAALEMADVIFEGGNNNYYYYGGYHVTGQNTSKIDIQRCTFNGGYMGIYLYGSNIDVTLIDNEMNNLYYGLYYQDYYGYYGNYGGVSKLKAENNTLNNMTYYGLYIYSYDYYYYNNTDLEVQLIGNTTTGSYYGNFIGGVANSEIRDNYVEGSLYQGMYIYRVNNSVIDNNVSVHPNNSYNYGGYYSGMYIYDSHNNLFSNNAVCGKDGFYMNYGSGNTFSNNSVANANIGLTLGYSANNNVVAGLAHSNVNTPVVNNNNSGNSVSNVYQVVGTGFCAAPNQHQPPVAACKDASVTLSGGMATLLASQVDDGSLADAGLASLDVSPAQFTCNDIGSHQVTLTITDVNGDSDQCQANVDVLGDIPSCSVASVPSSSTFTGGDDQVLYLGYGAQSTTLASSATGGSGFTYSWVGADLDCNTCANPVFTPSSEGNYSFTLTVTNSNGCTSTCTISICVYDIRVPGKKGKASNKVVVCKVPPGNPGNAHTIEVSVNAVASHLANGSTLGACDKVACSSLDPKSKASDALVTFEEAIGQQVSLFPNPSENIFNLRMDSESDEAFDYSIYDLKGKLIQAGSANVNSDNRFNLVLEPGVYMVHVSQGEYRETLRLIKK